MEGNYRVLFGNQSAGKVQLTRQGLYYRILCRCQLSGEVVCRLYVRCGGKEERLGILVPMGEGFGLDTRVPVKRIGEGDMAFFLRPAHDVPQGTFVPLSPEEPFMYLSRLKDAYLEKREGQMGAILRESNSSPTGQ